MLPLRCRFSQVRLAPMTGLLILCSCAWSAPGWEDFYPETPDPFMGDYKGRWSEHEDVDPSAAAQVIALGRDRYRIRFMAKLDMRAPRKFEVEVQRSGKSLKFDKDGHFGEIRNGRFTGGRKRGSATFSMEKITMPSPTVGAKPPAGAVVLFDGSNFDAWESPEGWDLVDGAMMVTPKGRELVSKRSFKDVRMHVEFRNSFMPRARGQQRSNSGVFVQDLYEVQVLDSYGLEGVYDECGALYKVAAPRVNACRPPLQWQAYDIAFRAARFDADGQLTENPRITVHHNGVLIHNDQELWWLTAWKEDDRHSPHSKDPGHIRLQGHNNYVQYRNIWLVEGTGEN